MKPQLLKIHNPLDHSFNLFDQKCTYFATPWHYHPEIELVFIEQGTGEKYVGSSVTNFGPGDFVMIGPYLPHYYKSNPEYYATNTTLQSHSLVIHFQVSMLEPLLDKPELNLIKQLIENSQRGLQFGRDFSEMIRADFFSLARMEGMDRMIGLLGILNKLSKTKDFDFLTSDPIHLTNNQDSDRIQKVFEFAIQNYKQNIRLSEVASLASMSESAFSRYFKKRTRKTFSTFLTEIRIEQACKLLQKDKLSVSEISYECGFNNLSNFNRQFRVIKSTTPLSYRSRFLD